MIKVSGTYFIYTYLPYLGTLTCRQRMLCGKPWVAASLQYAALTAWYETHLIYSVICYFLCLKLPHRLAEPPKLDVSLDAPTA